MNQVKAEVLGNELVLPGLQPAAGRWLNGTYRIRLRAPEIAGQASPGQFAMLRCGHNLLPRPFSVHGVDSDAITILYAVREGGAGSSWLAQRRQGDTIALTGPLGNGYSVLPGARNLLLVAGGIGIAPLCFLADKVVKTGKALRLLMGSITVSQLLSREFVPDGAEIICSTEDGSFGKAGLVTELLHGNAPWADQVFACGPLPMYRDMAEKRSEYGLAGKPVQVSLEMRMACGLGVCYGCTVNTRGGLKQACKDGPVFEIGDIVWDELARL